MLKNISDSELISNTKRLAAEERRLLARVLEHLEEIERRRLHLEMGYSSLYPFCQEELGYTENEAFTRISAMRLSRAVPEVVQAVEEGRLSLTNLATAQSYFKKAAKPVSVEEKRQLLKEIEGMSTRACAKMLGPVDALAKKTFEVDEALLADLQRIRELWGNQDLSDMELLRKMAKVVLAKIDPGLKQSACAPKVVAGPPASMITPKIRYIPAAIRRAVWSRDEGRCTYVHEGRRCGSRHALQLDHLDPYAYGGAHTADNLRLLCRGHHQLRTHVAIRGSSADNLNQ